jgi:peptide deformylase
MAILKIARMGHRVLQRRAAEVDDPTSPAIIRLIADMKDTLDDANGAGLAAPQVHVPLRLVMFMAPALRNGGEAVPLTVLINPVIEPLDDELHVGYEGCLSLPGLSGAVPRFMRIRYRALTPAGEQIDRVAEGFHARVVQHECDHLDGILYPMRMPDLATFGFVEEVRRSLMEPADDEGE